MKDKEQILNEIYEAYGSDSGVLLGIKEKDVVRTIIEFTLNRIKSESEPEQRTFSLKEASDILNEAKNITRQMIFKCPHCEISPVMCKCCGEIIE